MQFLKILVALLSTRNNMNIFRSISFNQRYTFSLNFLKIPQSDLIDKDYCTNINGYPLI